MNRPFASVLVVGESGDMKRTLAYPEVLERPTSMDGVFTFDLKRKVLE